MAGRTVTLDRLYRSGPDEQRMLLVGDSSALEPSNLGLGARLITALHALDGRGVTLDIAATGHTAPSALSGPDAAYRLWRYETVIVLLGPSAARLSLIRLRRQLLQIEADLAADTRLVLALLRPVNVGLPGRHARTQMDRLVYQLQSAQTRSTLVVHDLTLDGYLESPDVFVMTLAEAATTALPINAMTGGATARQRREQPQDETRRRGAAGRTLRMTLPAGDLQQLTDQARGEFAVPHAQITLVERNSVAISRAGEGHIQNDPTLCRTTVDQASTVLVLDTHLDHRFNSNPNVHGPDPIRFYAAHPIESPDGYRVGTLAVFDRLPHPNHAGPVERLRTLARQAESLLKIPGPSERPTKPRTGHRSTTGKYALDPQEEQL